MNSFNNKLQGITLIEVIVAMAVIALLSSFIVATTTTSRTKARDSQRIQNARQIAIALEQYEASTNSYKIPNVGMNNEGGGYVAVASDIKSTYILGTGLDVADLI